MLKKMISQKEWLYSGLIIFVFFVYNLNSQQILFYLGCLLLFGTITLLNNKNAMVVLCTIVPNLMMIRQVDSPKAIIGYTVFVLLFKEILANKFKIRADKRLLVILLLHFLTVGFSVVFQDSNILLRFVRFATFILFICMLFLNETINKDYYAKLIDSFALGCTMCVVFGMLFWILEGKLLLSGHFAGIRNDRNYFGITMAIGIEFLLVKSIIDKKITIFTLLNTVACLSGGLLSGSRTFLLISVPGVYLVFRLVKESRKTIKHYAMVLAGILVVCLMASSALGDSLKNIIDRFYESDVQDANGRFNAWQFYIKEFTASIDRILFGYGSSGRYLNNGIYSVVEHNILLDTLGSIGSVGCAVAIMTYYRMMLCVVNPPTLLSCSGRIKPVACIPLIVILLGYCTLNGLYSDNFSYALLVSGAVMAYSKF